MRAFIILVFSWLSLPCFSQTVLKTDQVTRLEVLAKSADKIPVDKVIVDWELIPLETSADALFGEAYGLRYYKGHFYMSDGRPMNLFMFGENGEFKGKVGKRGDGPEEYISLNDFEIDKATGDLIIYSSNGMSLYHYDLNGSFIKRQKLDFFASSFEIIDKNRLGFYANYQVSEYGRKNVLVTDRAGQVQQRLISFPAIVDRSIGYSGAFRAFDDKFFYNHAYSDTLWVLDQQMEVQQALLFDFEGRQWPYGFAFQKVSVDYSYLGKRLYSDVRFLFLSFLHQRMYRPVIYSWTDMHLYNEHSFNNPFLFRLVKTPATKMDNSFYLSTINAQALSQLIFVYPDEWKGFQKEFPKRARLLKAMLEEEGNPVVIKYRIN